MKLHTTTLISALKAAHPTFTVFSVLVGKEYKRINEKLDVADAAEFEYQASKGKEVYRGVIFADGESRSVLPTGGCKGTGKARRVGSVGQIHELFTANNPTSRKEAIALAVSKGYNKYTAQTQYQVWNSSAVEVDEADES
jgi:hypothetical protein